MRVAQCPPPPKVEATPFPRDPVAVLRGARRTPEALTDLGYEVAVDLARPYSLSGVRKVGNGVAIVDATAGPGGWVAVVIRDRRADEIVGYGVSRCNPDDDWDAKLGFEIAYGRAYTQAFGR